MPIATMSVTIQDDKGLSTARVRNVQTFAVNIDYATMTLVDLNAWFMMFADRVDDLTDGVIIGGNINLQPTLPVTLKTVPVANSDVQEGALLSYALVDSTYVESLRVPAFKQSLFGADGQSVPSGAEVGALSILLRGEAATAEFPAVNRYGIALSNYRSGRKSFRK